MNAPQAFRKRPVEVLAMQYTRESCRDICRWAGLRHENDDSKCGRDVLLIPTLEGTMTAQLGDWIVRGVQGEFYPCKPDIFEQTYEPA